MLAIRRGLIAFLAIWGVASAASAQVAAPARPSARVAGFRAEGLEKLDALIAGKVARNEIAGAVGLLVRDGKVGYSKAAGMLDREAGTAMPADAIFRIASMTKPITSVAAMILVDEGKLKLDDPVGKYIPEFRGVRVLDPGKGLADGTPATVASRRPIRIRDLLNHTSGLGYRFLGGPLGELYAKAGISDGLTQTEGTIGDNVRKIAAEPILFEPGTAWSYSIATDVLGRVIEVASGQDLDSFFRDRIFKPLAMKDTAFFLPPEKTSRLAVLYAPGPDKSILRVGESPITVGTLVYSSSYQLKGPRTYFSGGAGLTSTAGDYARFLQMLLNGGELDGVRLLRPETVKAMTSNQIGDLAMGQGPHGDRFGYGFGVVTPAGKANTPMSVGSYSWAGFFHTFFWVDPEKRLVGVIMAQAYPSGDTKLHADFVKAAYEALEE